MWTFGTPSSEYSAGTTVPILKAKIDHRTEMARQLGVSIETLRVRMCRIRTALEKCIKRCLDELGSAQVKRIE